MAKAKRKRRRHRKNGSLPTWFPYALVASGLLSLYLWKKANPGQTLNPTAPGPAPV
jgi:hypothetical protein